MRQFLIIFFILITVATLSVCLIKPDMHKTVILYDSAYTITPEEEVTVENTNIPILEQPVKPKAETVKAETVVAAETKPVKSQTVTKSVTTNKTKTQTAETSQKTPAVTKTTQTKQPVTVKVTEPAQKVTTVNAPIPAGKKQVIQTEPKIVTKTEPAQTVKKTLTQQEENIAWNVWRSNLQNKIMQDTKLPYIPNGVVFKFSFTVDSNGRISNLQTWSENQGYTPYAIQYIAPVIRSYQGRSILDFPSGTARLSTEVKGGWKISQNEKYSSPSDYNDVERVIK